MKPDRTTIKDPRNPEYHAEARDAIMDCCPFYDPNHKGGVVREEVFKECLGELRARISMLNDVISSNRATMDTLREQLKADEKAAYDLRCLLHEVADHCGISTSLWPSAIADRLKQLKDDKDEIENMWEQLCRTMGVHGPQSDPLTGSDTNDMIQKRAMERIREMAGANL